MNIKNASVSSRRDFRYPPIFPIVYYEGKKNWTAASDLSDRILCGELLGKYLPHFKYQLVRLHDYSNEELLAKGDEISLVMMINKIQSVEDISAFQGLSQEQIDRILKDTPDYLLDTMSKVMRALLYSMEIPESETESVVAKVKERKMGQLFEQVPKNIRAERKKWKKEAEAERDTAFAERDKAFEARDKAFEARDEAFEARDKAFEARDKAYAELNAFKEGSKEREILKHVNRMLRKGASDEGIITSLISEFSLTEEQAEETFRKIFEE